MTHLHEEIRKGPWTEQEDNLLIYFVNLFGDRRWDFIAKVSGLNRTGKSCRLRWVNYLHPGLKRGKMTPHEEKLVLELHEKWGNRWSRIARKLPGRTDNEIKNYWRTHTRKKAQERKRFLPSSPPSSICSSSSVVMSGHPTSPREAEERTSDSGLALVPTSGGHENNVQGEEHGTYSMDDIWKVIETTTDPVTGLNEGCNFSCLPIASPVWQGFPDTQWRVEDQDNREMNSTEKVTCLITL